MWISIIGQHCELLMNQLAAVGFFSSFHLCIGQMCFFLFVLAVALISNIVDYFPVAEASSSGLKSKSLQEVQKDSKQMLGFFVGHTLNKFASFAHAVCRVI